MGSVPPRVDHGSVMAAGQVRARLSMSQTDLARRAEVAQGTVSNYFRGQPIRADHAQRILQALAEEITLRSTNGGLSKEEASSLRDQIDRALEVASGRSTPAARRSLPGGAIPPDAANLVWREKEIKKYIDNGLRTGAVTMRVEGPPHCGKSTLLLQVAQEARRMGYLVTTFDRSCMPVDKNGEGTEKSFSVLAGKIAQTWGIGLPYEIEDSSSLQTFIRDEREKRADRPALIVVDDVSTLSESVREGLVDVCRNLHNERTALNLSWLLAIEPSSPEVRDLLKKSSAYFGPTEPRMKWFNDKEVQQLLAAYPELLAAYPEFDFGPAALLLKKFKGQPFLTHVAIDLLIGEISPKEIDKESASRGGKFGKHLAVLLKAVDEKLLTKLSSVDFSLNDLAPEDRSFLIDLCVVTDGQTGLIPACLFYAEAIPIKAAHS